LTPAEARLVAEWNDTPSAAVDARFSPWKPLRQHPAGGDVFSPPRVRSVPGRSPAARWSVA